MGLSGTRTYVGFGFGAIQAGLFLYEAFGSGAFGRLVVAEVLPEVVSAVRRAGGYFCVNIAHSDRVEHAVVGPVAIEDPASASDRERLIEAIAEAEEIGTAIPSVAYYVREACIAFWPTGCERRWPLRGQERWFTRQKTTTMPPRYWNRA
jgi:hypothetical protein